MSRRFTIFVASASLFVAAQSLRAQAPAQPAGAAPAAPAPGAVAAPPATVDDPTVKALLDTNPSTPRDLFRVIGLLVEMGYPQVAKPLLTKLSEAAADEAKLAEVGRQFGRPAVEKLATAPAVLQPDARNVADQILKATHKQDRDPARIASLIALLKDPSYEARVNAMTALRAGEDASVDALLTVLLDPSRQAEHAQIRTALAAMDQYAVGPITAMAGAKDEAVQVAALQTAALMSDTDSLAPLYGAAFAPGQSTAVRQTGTAALEFRLKKLPRPEEASAELYVAARRAYLRAGNHLVGEQRGEAVSWRWNEMERRPVSTVTSEQVAELERTINLARFAGTITGGRARYLHLAAELEAKLVMAGEAAAGPVAEGWSANFKTSRTDLEGLLEYTLELEHERAAAVIVRLLAATGGKPSLVSPVAGRPSALVKAAVHPDRRVRFAAVDAVLALGPMEPFVGAGGVYDAVGYFAASIGAKKALVVDVSPIRARNVAGLLVGLGYRPETAASTRDAMQLLSQDADFEMVLVARQMLLPQMGGLTGQLRGDYRTRGIPVAVYCGPDELEHTRTLLPDDGLTIGVYEPRSIDSLEKQLRGAAGFRIREEAAPVESDVRLAQGTAMAVAGAKLLDAGNTSLNLRPYETQLTTAAFHPLAGKHLAPLLGRFGSPTAQRTLADVASSAALPLEQRQAASRAFCESVIRFGTLLTKSEVLRQYERYNASESLDKPTQELLAALLDVIEAKAAQLTLGSGARAAKLLSPAASSAAPAFPAATSPPAGAPPATTAP